MFGGPRARPELQVAWVLDRMRLRGRQMLCVYYSVELVRGDCVDDRLERALHGLKVEPLDVRLDQLEPMVWARIERGRESAGFFLPVRAAAVLTALVLGVAIGGLGAGKVGAQRQEVAVFSPEPTLAPSTLLESL